MTIGLDFNGKRIPPHKTGRATCQICSGEVIAKCGEIYDWHWAHKIDRNCDPWKEHETEWHRQWKNKFPFEWREVPIENDEGERHFADVKTSSGLVIEFQNSSISTTTIRIREEFYGDMIWVINAQPFKDHLRLASVVKRKVREIEAAEKDPYVELEQDLKNQIEALSKSIDEIQGRITPVFEEIKRKRGRLTFLNDHLANVHELTERIIKSWFDHLHIDYQLSELVNRVDQHYPTRIRGLAKELNEIKEKLAREERNLQMIQKLEQIELGNVSHRIVPSNWISAKNYSNAMVIEKETKSTLFVNSRRISSEFDLQRLQQSELKYVFCLDVSIPLQSINNATAMLKKDLETLQNYLPSVKQIIHESLLNNLRNMVSETEKGIETQDSKWDELLSQKSDLEIRKGTLEMKIAEEVPIAKKEAAEELKNEKFSVMRSEKGQYHFRWKHERKSWQAAGASMFFDIGEDYLLKRLTESLVYKVKLTDFLKDYGHLVSK
jgi:competence CoiA-like predicted nuclease